MLLPAVIALLTIALLEAMLQKAGRQFDSGRCAGCILNEVASWIILIVMFVGVWRLIEVIP